jgi:hypothetical protein
MNNIDPSLLLIIGAIVVVLGVVTFVVDQKDVVVAAMGVLGGGVITNYFLATNQEWQWSLVATILATVIFILLIKMENIGLGIAAALIGIFGSFLGYVLTWSVDVNVDNLPLGVLLVIIVGLILMASFAGLTRRRRARRVVTTTTTAP